MSESPNEMTYPKNLITVSNLLALAFKRFLAKKQAHISNKGLELNKNVSTNGVGFNN